MPEAFIFQWVRFWILFSDIRRCDCLQYNMGNPSSQDSVSDHSWRSTFCIRISSSDIFNNPIAGPFVLGISSGAKLVVALLMIYFLSRSISMGSAAMIIAAFIGSMISMGFVLLVAKSPQHVHAGYQRCHDRLHLFCSYRFRSYICGWLQYRQSSQLVTGKFFRMSWGNVKVMAIVVLLTMVIVFFMSKPIGAYQLGEVYAQNMGVNIKLFRIGLILLSVFCLPVWQLLQDQFLLLALQCLTL